MNARTDPLAPDRSWRGLRVGILGLGRSGRAAAGLLLDEEAQVTAFDDRPVAKLTRDIAELSGRLRSVLEASGTAARDALSSLQALVVSPGVAPRHPLVRWAEARGIPVVGELDLAARRIRCPSIVVTGTNGKSTTVSLLHHVLEVADRKPLLMGNIGTAASALAAEASADRVAVIEASSFQLERVRYLHPRVAVLLNVAADHLDRYPDVETYAEAKRRLLTNLGNEDAFVFPAGDRFGETWSEATPALALRFGVGRIAAAAPGVGMADGWIVRRWRHAAERVLPAGELPLLGAHNLENALAAVAALLPFEVPVAALRDGLATFTGLPHRLQPVAEVDGVLFVDDSKATNVHAALTALAGMERPVVLLVGGRGKGEDYASLRDQAGHIRVAVCYGEEGPRLAAALQSAMPVQRAEGLEAALEQSVRAARRGDVVLLAPACASFDEFTSFEERGGFFEAWVERWSRR